MLPRRSPRATRWLEPPNRLEHDLGFFVKQGDGAADLKPIAHLYKSQVYQLAEYLGVPDAIRRRPPTTDTYSLDQSQEEFFFGLSLRQTGHVAVRQRSRHRARGGCRTRWDCRSNRPARAYGVVDSKRHAARYLLMPPLLIEHEETRRGDQTRAASAFAKLRRMPALVVRFAGWRT